MDTPEITDVLRNLDQRLAHVEQVLPTLVTNDRFEASVATLAAKEELAEAVARLATKEELREDGERTRRHFDIVAENMRSEMRARRGRRRRS